MADSHGEATGLWSGIGRDALVLGIAATLEVALQLAFRGVALSSLDPSEYGRLALLISAMGLVTLVAASGIPNTLAKLVAGESDDAGDVRAGLMAATAPVALATLALAAFAAVVAPGAWSSVLSILGLAPIVFALILAGVMRGRGSIKWAAGVQVVNASAQLVALAAIAIVATAGVSATVAYLAYTVGNISALLFALFGLSRSGGLGRAAAGRVSRRRSRRILAVSTWLSLAAVGLAVLPFAARVVAASASLAEVAAIDIALLLFVATQRFATILVQSVVPHASRQTRRGISPPHPDLRDHLLLLVLFLVLSAVAAETDLVSALIGSISEPGYDTDMLGKYVGIVLLAAPARVLYGVIAGFMVAHGRNHDLAVNSWLITLAALPLLWIAFQPWGPTGLLAVFSIANWGIYLTLLRRYRRISRATISLARSGTRRLLGQRPVKEPRP